MNKPLHASKLLGYHGIHGGVNDLPAHQCYDLIIVAVLLPSAFSGAQEELLRTGARFHLALQCN
jgi:hypothetical protein